MQCIHLVGNHPSFDVSQHTHPLSYLPQVLLLREGRLIYQGPTKEAIPHFERLGYRHPDKMDPADFLLEVRACECVCACECPCVCVPSTWWTTVVT